MSRPLQYSSLFLYVITFSLLTPTVEAGCWQRRLCCPGRNASCKATDDGISHLPSNGNAFIGSRHQHQRIRDRYTTSTTSTTSSPYEYVMPRYEGSGEDYRLLYPDVIDEYNHEKIGRLILPDVIELEGSGGEKIYKEYEGSGIHEEGSGDIYEGNGPQTSYPLMDPSEALTTTTTPRPSPVRMFKHMIFGMPEGPDTEPVDELRYHDKPKLLLIRYSILSQHLPLTVSTTTVPLDDEPQLMYLEAPEMECYCDEECVKLGDCCSDYTYVCPPQDCLVDHWAEWEKCVPDKGSCGMGVQQRTRRVRAYAERGGAECPALTEMRTCWKECARKRNTDITTVALIIDYRYNKTRSEKRRNTVYWDLPEVTKKLQTASHYCVEYELGWVNRNCLNKQLTKRLYRGNRICAECQPAATLHRSNGRCASDLEDGERGFWKLVGPKSCNGIWTRIVRTNNCTCSGDLPDLDPFLLV